MSKQSEFIETIGRLAQNEYAARNGKAILPSVCIAQGALESGWNLNAKTLFGIKGKGFTASTCEYYNGVKTQIVDSFRTYPNVASAVVGYYDFIAKTPRYAHCNGEKDYKKVVYNLQHTLDGKAYATDPAYEGKIISIIEKYNLTSWDSVPTQAKPSNNDISYKVGQNYTLQANVIVRSNPSKSATPVGHKGLTADGKKHDKDKNGSLDKGTVITCKDVKVENGNIWIKCPSGWLAALYNGEVLIK